MDFSLIYFGIIGGGFLVGMLLTNVLDWVSERKPTTHQLTMTDLEEKPSPPTRCPENYF